MGVAKKLTELRWRFAGHYSRRLPHAFVAPLQRADALEIGGPSKVFTSGGLLPVYPVLARVDGVQWTAETMWHTLNPGDGYRPEGRRRGELLLLDGVDLDPIRDHAYDAVISSHVIEHIANPLRAVAAWRRVTRPGGHLLIIAPHMSGTFDRRRPLTSLQHMVDDHARGIDEGDLTHLDETLRLHDRRRDAEQGDAESWAQRRRENPQTRLLHHHTFTTTSLLELLDHAGLELLVVETRFPHDIYALGRWPTTGRPENRLILAARHKSPFRVDAKRAESAGRSGHPLATGGRSLPLVSVCWLCLGPVEACARFAPEPFVECPRCDFVFRPDLDSAAIKRTYADGAYEAMRREHYMAALADRSRDARVRLCYLEPWAESGKLLDVGAAGGAFVAEATKRGFVASGVEPVERFARAAREELGVDVQHGSVEDLELASARYDVITLWHVLEHLPDPVSKLRHLASGIPAGGLLALEVPNAGSAVAHHMGCAWPSLEPSVHVSQFTPTSLRRALEQAGFALCDLRTTTITPYLRARRRFAPGHLAGRLKAAMWLRDPRAEHRHGHELLRAIARRA